MKKVNKITLIENGDSRLVGHYVEGMGIVQKTKCGVREETETKGMTVAEMMARAIKNSKKNDVKR